MPKVRACHRPLSLVCAYLGADAHLRSVGTKSGSNRLFVWNEGRVLLSCRDDRIRCGSDVGCLGLLVWWEDTLFDGCYRSPAAVDQTEMDEPAISMWQERPVCYSTDCRLGRSDRCYSLRCRKIAAKVSPVWHGGCLWCLDKWRTAC